MPSSHQRHLPWQHQAILLAAGLHKCIAVELGMLWVILLLQQVMQAQIDSHDSRLAALQATQRLLPSISSSGAHLLLILQLGHGSLAQKCKMVLSDAASWCTARSCSSCTCRFHLRGKHAKGMTRHLRYLLDVIKITLPFSIPA